MALIHSQLLMRTGPTPGKVIELNQAEMSIGRDVLNEIVIDDPEVSRKHASLTAQAGGYIIEDLGSTNGTQVNGQRLLGPHLLRSGETIQLGDSVSLVFETLEFDPHATLASGAGAKRPIPPPNQEQVLPQAGPPPQPTYSGQLPQGPAEPFVFPLEEEPPKKPTRAWLWAGLGCLVVVICVCVAGLVVVDTLNLYCVPPLRTIIMALGLPCP